MPALRARVRDGRIVLDEPTDLPNGTVLDLVVDDEGDDLDDAERAKLNEAISRAWRSIQSGHGRPVREVIDGLTAKR
jgi:hypothetical protein